VTLLGHKPTICTSPREALQQVDQHHFDLILADFHMPEIDGEQFYRLVVARHPDLAHRMVFITGDSFGDEVNRFFAATDLPHLDKPCSIATLRQTIHDHLPQAAMA
jgi:CheY-like chemotaxis protein